MKFGLKIHVIHILLHLPYVSNSKTPALIELRDGTRGWLRWAPKPTRKTFKNFRNYKFFTFKTSQIFFQ